MKQLLSNQKIILILGIVFIFNISLSYLIQYSWMQSSSNFLPIIKNTSSLKYELASGHIWLEEFLQGDKTVDINKEVFDRGERVEKLYLGIKRSILEADFSDKYFDKVTAIEMEFNDLMLLAKKRLSDPKKNMCGSSNDMLFDTKYNNLQKLIQEFENGIYTLLENERYNKNILFTFIIVLLIIFNGVIFYLLYRLRQRNVFFKSEALEQKKAFEAIYQKSTDGIILASNGFIIDCNEAFITMMHAKNKEELLEMHPSEFSPILQPDGTNSYTKSCEMIELCVKNGTNQFEWMHKNLDGEEFMVELVLTYIKINHEDVIHAVVRDISKRLKLEEDYKQSQKAMYEQAKTLQTDAILSNIAHQWKQPLAKINSRLIDLSSSLNLKAKEQDILDTKIEKIEELTTYLADTIENFRTYFQPKKNKSSFVLKKLFEKAISLSSLDDNQSLTSLMMCCDEDLELYEFEDELLQVIIILLNNAQDAHKKNDTKNPFIIIEVIDYSTYIRIGIRDNAGGIDDKILKDIFTPYFSTKKDTNNSGIGLYIAKTIVERSLNSTIDYIKKDNESSFIFNCVTKRTSK